MTIGKEDIKKVGSILKAVREKESVTQTEMMKRMKKHQSFISNVENTIKVASLVTIVSYLDKLGYVLCIQKKDAKKPAKKSK
jgi:transcriptional regulator with XRE-family HTH domain